MLGHLHRCYTFKKAFHASPFLFFQSPLMNAIMEPSYLKSCPWLIVLPYISSGGCRQLITIYSVFDALIKTPRSAAADRFLLAGTAHEKWKTQARRFHLQSPSHLRLWLGTFLIYVGTSELHNHHLKTSAASNPPR